MKSEQFAVLLIPDAAFIFLGRHKNTEPEQQQPKVKYVAMGDSLAIGLITLGSGYVNQYCSWLLKNRYPQGIDLVNLGTSGWKSGDILKALQENQHYMNAVQSADILTLDVGGNDLLGANFTRQGLRLAL